jgi:hypothetical protein
MRLPKQLLDDFREGTEYWKQKEEALDRILHRTCLGRQTTEWRSVSETIVSNIGKVATNEFEGICKKKKSWSKCSISQEFN